MLEMFVNAAHLGKDADVRFTQTGTKVLGFSVASDRQYTGNDGNLVKETIWLQCSLFPTSDAQAKFFEDVLKKGSKVSFTATLQPDRKTGGPRVWTRQDGTAGASYDVRIDPFTLDVSKNGEVKVDASGMPEQSEEAIPF